MGEYQPGSLGHAVNVMSSAKWFESITHHQFYNIAKESDMTIWGYINERQCCIEEPDLGESPPIIVKRLDIRERPIIVSNAAQPCNKGDRSMTSWRDRSGLGALIPGLIDVNSIYTNTSGIVDVHSFRIILDTSN